MFKECWGKIAHVIISFPALPPSRFHLLCCAFLFSFLFVCTHLLLMLLLLLFVYAYQFITYSFVIVERVSLPKLKWEKPRNELEWKNKTGADLFHFRRIISSSSTVLQQHSVWRKGKRFEICVWWLCVCVYAKYKNAIVYDVCKSGMCTLQAIGIGRWYQA